MFVLCVYCYENEERKLRVQGAFTPNPVLRRVVQRRVVRRCWIFTPWFVCVSCWGPLLIILPKGEAAMLLYQDAGQHADPLSTIQPLLYYSHLSKEVKPVLVF